PPVGWPRWQVSWLAGQYLRSSLPSFPVADADDRLAAYSCGGSHGFGQQADPCSLLPPRLSPGNQHPPRILSAPEVVKAATTQDHGALRPGNTWMIARLGPRAGDPAGPLNSGPLGRARLSEIGCDDRGFLALCLERRSDDLRRAFGARPPRAQL